MVWASYIQSAIDTQQNNRRTTAQDNNKTNDYPEGSVAPPPITPSGPTIADRILHRNNKP